MGDDDLDIPNSNREIALHLRAIKTDLIDIKTRVVSLENAGRSKLEVFTRNFLLPVASGIVLFLITQLSKAI